MSNNVNEGPDFLGIGAARSGTTWIAKQLEESPEVWLPKRKELHYFSRSQDYLSPSYFADNSALRRLFGLEERNRIFKRKFATSIAGSLFKLDAERLAWELKYFLGDCSIEWYKSLFPNDGRITGEITPAYALLDDEKIQEIVAMNPNIKIIYIIRNPIERAWSTFKYHAKRGKKNLMDYEDYQIIQYVNQPNILERSKYTDVINKWMRHIPEKQFLLLFYDDITARSQYITNKLHEFLGIKTEIKIDNSTDKINKSFDMDMPELVRKNLCATYCKSIEELEARVGGPASDWLEHVRSNT